MAGDFNNFQPAPTDNALSDRYRRAMLRRATEQGLLTGWNGPHFNGSYSIAPKNAPAGEWSEGRVREYVVAMEVAGFRPLYRDSEPVL